MVFSLVGPTPSMSGDNPYATMVSDALKKRKMMMENQYYPKTQEALIQNLLMKPQQTQADIALKQAHGGLLGEQQKFYGAKAQADIGSKNMQQMKMQMMMDAIGKARERESQERQQTNASSKEQQGGFQNIASIPEGQLDGQPEGDYNQYPSDFKAYNMDFNQGSPQHAASEKVANELKKNNPMEAYGVKLPQPSSEDMQNKVLFGIDSYSDKLKQAKENQQIQQKEFMARSQENNAQANMSNDFIQKLDQYNHLMDNSILSGSLMSKVPGSGMSSQSQQIDQLSNEMRLSSIENLKKAMGNARFSNLDMNVASEMKPNRNWNDETRRFYTNFAKTMNERINDKSQFYNLAANPKLGISSTTADALWSSYQHHHPLVKSPKDMELNHYEKNNFIRYLTPEAIKAVQTKGDYNPKDKGLKPNYSLEDLRAEMKRRAKLKRA